MVITIIPIFMDLDKSSGQKIINAFVDTCMFLAIRNVKDFVRNVPS